MQKIFSQTYTPPALGAAACLVTGAAQMAGVPVIGTIGIILGAGLIGLAAWCLVFRVWPVTSRGTWTEEWQRLNWTGRVVAVLAAACPGLLAWPFLPWPSPPLDPAIAAMVSAGLPAPMMTPAGPAWGISLSPEVFSVIFAAVMAAVLYGLFSNFAVGEEKQCYLPD
ncbi:MAG: hypothetical protein PHW74_03665 [Desulfobacca sp.]|nr:hypothetical protein [Desulfobacca sp.]